MSFQTKRSIEVSQLLNPAARVNGVVARPSHAGILEPAEPSRLTWLRPRTMSEAQFSGVRSRLGDLVQRRQSDQVYAHKSRSIYRVEDPELGVVAIKELRYENIKRQIEAAYHKRHRELCEFRVGSGFEARGGKTPSILGAALESGSHGLSRILILRRWIEGAVELQDALKQWSDPPNRRLLRHLGRELVQAAKVGLVHGRHSPRNLLVSAETDPPDIYVIDFAYSQLLGSFDPRGFARDVARIAARLTKAEAISDQSREVLFDEISAQAWRNPAESEPWRQELQWQYRFFLGASKVQQHNAVKRKTFLRGLPHRI